MRRPWGEVVAGVACVVLGVAATAGAATFAGPEGAWETQDERTGMPRAVVRVAIRETELAGVIERIFPRPGEGPDPTCTRCEGSLRNKPVLGMEILRGLRRDGDRWVDGSILDPENGKTYRTTVWLDKQERLRVRGYWGPFYRTQTWRRAGGNEAESPGPGERPQGRRP